MNGPNGHAARGVPAPVAANPVLLGLARLSRPELLLKAQELVAIAAAAEERARANLVALGYVLALERRGPDHEFHGCRAGLPLGPLAAFDETFEVATEVGIASPPAPAAAAAPSGGDAAVPPGPTPAAPLPTKTPVFVVTVTPRAARSLVERAMEGDVPPPPRLSLVP